MPSGKVHYNSRYALRGNEQWVAIDPNDDDFSPGTVSWYGEKYTICSPENNATERTIVVSSKKALGQLRDLLVAACKKAGVDDEVEELPKEKKTMGCGGPAENCVCD